MWWITIQRRQRYFILNLAYRCYDCMTEENSVVCPDCFELDKHMGHEYERFEVYGGCCDCGDI